MNFENRLAFGEVTDNNLMSCLLLHSADQLPFRQTANLLLQ